ncbi:MAG: fluoride efflux transporter CrcB [Lachnospiraceae bacterium]|nr:fluoride efflux transporter CrcB [Lachnospiraceae bacterium]
MGFLYVGLGGALGAMLRYAISMLPGKGTFPVWTLVTNVLGAILIGFVVQIAAQRDISPNGMLFLKTGVCGGFTTFSTFSLEAYTLYEKHLPGQACLYIILSVVLCLGGIYLGTLLASAFRSGTGM